ncbi:probable N-acetyltransferase HLS1-like isoform X1 [Ananas comosus]|uniref:Probable N-acetyltransferase HLS1-like isoform X1 n=1 Tax=Ananas comosus TaxID=4615 RepID=A0A6P5FRP0_ANACO|nr:probable N-acetyltransferase HLS1-like isoform X1 [Ananas comosus]
MIQVAEVVSGPDRAIVGLVRGCVKSVSRGSPIRLPAKHHTAAEHRTPLFSTVAYLLGLRVSPPYRKFDIYIYIYIYIVRRRRGIGQQLVQRMEEWFVKMGAEYAYMATDIDNAESIRLFTGRCGYSKFRTPSILVHPVYAHRLRLKLPRHAAVHRLSPADADLLYRRRFSSVEFFPGDIDAVLRNPSSLGTFVAVPRTSSAEEVVGAILGGGGSFRLEVRGAPRWLRGLARATRAVDAALPWLGLPSIPDVFRPFGVCFVYGLGGAGPDAPALLRALFRHAHNLARSLRCGVVAAEVAACEPLRAAVPRWDRLTVNDLWCVKRLPPNADADADADVDWIKAPPGPSIFVDPREV